MFFKMNAFLVLYLIVKGIYGSEPSPETLKYQYSFPSRNLQIYLPIVTMRLVTLGPTPPAHSPSNTPVTWITRLAFATVYSSIYVGKTIFLNNKFWISSWGCMADLSIVNYIHQINTLFWNQITPYFVSLTLQPQTPRATPRASLIAKHLLFTDIMPLLRGRRIFHAYF